MLEIVMSRDELSRALASATGACDKKGSIPMLAHIMFRSNGTDAVDVIGSDMEQTFCGTYDAQIISSGEICIPYDGAGKWVKQASNETVRMKEEANQWLHFTSGKAKMKLACLEARDFPSVITPDGYREMIIDSTTLHEMIRLTLFSVATDDSRYGLNGAYLEQLSETDIRMVSTDGHRLSLANRRLQSPALLTGEGVLLSRKGAQGVQKLCEEFKGTDVRVLVGKNIATFCFNRQQYSTRLLEGDFPDYRQVMPARYQRRIITNREMLISSIKRACVLSNEKTHSLRFSLKKNAHEQFELVLSASDPDRGETSEVVDLIQMDGSEMAVGFNGKYCIEALSAMGDEDIVMEFGDALHPCVIREVTGDSMQFIVMPMRIE